MADGQVVFGSSVQAVPGVPTQVGASPGNASATVNWSAPSSNGSPIASYTVTPYLNGVAQPATVVTGSPPAPSATVPGLASGTTYTFTVAATNAVGTSAQSGATGLVTPSPQPQGQWTAVQNMPFEAVSSILMDNGKFVFWDGWQQPQPSIVWDPATPATFTTINAPDSVFCDGAAQLPDGRIIVIGGYGGDRRLAPALAELGKRHGGRFDQIAERDGPAECVRVDDPDRRRAHRAAGS
ncbi:fibronectin type III domain-containing protein [Trebonia kvetii]|uniref:Fibronectin type III domain-containing protein n=1 Tax=Trebonia kvetii TaxID=2480626 RepID=A0A6P2BWP8_9ACTN|nr:fibronectin type III domain-containing protein [Trebonia kvetii]TVZ03559.1 fibronectin type III domain-containing protein [Trebonia kvetii]